MDLQQFIRDISIKEIECRCYDPNINGISIYSLIRRDTRTLMARKKGLATMQGRRKVEKWPVFIASLQSALQLCKLILFRKKYSTIFCAFPRVDKIQGVYLEKFTDPLIEQCPLKGNYLIFDHGFAGIHPKPRLHHKHIVYWDFIHVLSSFYTSIFYRHFYNRYKEQFDSVFKCMYQVYGEVVDKNSIVKLFLCNYTIYGIFRLLWKHLSAKQVIGPARPFTFFLAAKKLGIKAFELQHGITYGETELYSGYRDPMVTPDLFFAFGENRPLDVYGIEESRIVNIGWALNDYIARLDKKEQLGENDVLVISEPAVTQPILNTVQKLAQAFPSYVFHVRPHPHELLSDPNKKIFEQMSNVILQDKSINITEAMSGFKYVIGENSTVLYEAVSYGKKVGKLFFDGLSPIYLQPEDKNCFWEIYNEEDFIKFVRDDILQKQVRSIYSPFDKEKFLKYLD